MPHGVGRDVREGFILLVLLVVLLHKPLEHALIAGRRFGVAVLVEEQEILVTVDIDRRRLSPVLHSPLQRLVDLIAHGDLPGTAFGFRHIHIVAGLTIPENLVIYIDLPAFKIKIDRQAAEFGDTEAGSQKNVISSQYFR